ncbi:MAG: flagellin FliC [Magnetococcales bacterium]|nr:flagellin FliC [Magnetococcales bacterium]
MALVINSNIASLNAQRKLNATSNSLSSTFQRLSSGLRINSARDDAAGMAVSTRMTAQVRGLNQAVRNSNDAISMVQVAGGALDETVNALQRMRELVVQASSETLTSADRGDIWEEVTQLASEIDRIATNTNYNGQVLMTGGFSAATSGIYIQTGASAGQTMQINLGPANASNIGIGGAASIVTAYNVGGASAGDTGNTGLSTTDARTLMASMLGRVDDAIASVSDIRSELGAVQNRFESIMANLSNVSENTAQARSRIMDADIAEETSKLTKLSIMQQAGTAILAQANQQPQLALQLLG